MIPVNYGSFGVVFFENGREEIGSIKKDAWYFPHAFVLAPESTPVRSLIGRVPFTVRVASDGAVESIIEGKA